MYWQLVLTVKNGNSKKPSKKKWRCLPVKCEQKVIKQLQKIKFLISIYDLETFELINLVPDFTTTSTSCITCKMAKSWSVLMWLKILCKHCFT